jgi:UDP-glucose 4-epimerase
METYVISLAIEAARGQRAHFNIFGSDYPTRDGTCIRDFVHVSHLADAHVRAANYLLAGGTSVALNLGTGQGTSAKELIEAIEIVSRKLLSRWNIARDATVIRRSSWQIVQTQRTYWLGSQS